MNVLTLLAATTVLSTPTVLEERSLVIYDVADITSQVLKPISEQTAGTGITVSASLMSTKGNEKGERAGTEMKQYDPDAWLEELSNEERQEILVREAQFLASAVRTWIDPPLAEGDEVKSAGVGSLVVLANRERHAWTGDFLASVREYKALLRVSVRKIEAPAGTFAGLGFEGTSFALENADATAAFVEMLTSAGLDAEISPPHPLQLRGITPVSVGIGAFGHYVKDWRVVRVAPGGQKIVDPIVEDLASSYSTDLRAVPLGKGLYGLEFKYSESKHETPIATSWIDVKGLDEQKEVGVPEFTEFSVEARLQIRDGASVVTWNSRGDGKGEFGVLITAATR